MVRSSIRDQTISDPMAHSQTGSIAACVNSLGRRTTVYKRGASLIVSVVSVRGMRMGSRNRVMEMDSDTITLSDALVLYVMILSRCLANPIGCH